MNYDRFVEQPRILQERLNHAILKAERYKDLCTRATAAFSEIGRVQQSNVNTHETYLLEYADSQRAVHDLTQEYGTACDAVRTWLYNHMSNKYASMLEYRYIDGLTNAEIAATMHFAEQTMKNMISKAVREARKIYNYENNRQET